MTEKRKSYHSNQPYPCYFYIYFRFYFKNMESQIRLFETEDSFFAIKQLENIYNDLFSLARLLVFSFSIDCTSLFKNFLISRKILLFRLDNMVYHNSISGHLDDFFQINAKAAIICNAIERVLSLKCDRQNVGEPTQLMRDDVFKCLTDM